MRKIIDGLGIFGIALSTVILGVAYAQTSVSVVEVPVEETTKRNFPLNQPQEVTFEVNESFEKLAEPQQSTDSEKQGKGKKLSRQQEEQLRDWLLLTVLSGKGLSSEEITSKAYDISTMRGNFISSASNFEYGTTRSRNIDDDKIVALVSKTDSVEQRKNNLARIADRFREEQGKKPKIIEIFEYEINAQKQSAFITRRKEINAEQIFSPAYGYYETDITNQSELQNFLNQTDDLTFTQVNEYSLTIGGRKIFKDKNSPKSQVIRLEDVAALLQSDINNANGSLFSLDGEYDYPSLVKVLDSAKPLLKKLKLDGQRVISDKDIELAKQGLSRKDNKEYLNLIAKFKNFWKSEELVKKAFNQGELAAEVEKELKDYQEKEYKDSQESIKNHKEQTEQEKKLVLSDPGLSIEEINKRIIDIDKTQQDYEKKWEDYLEKEIPRKRKEIIYSKSNDLLDSEEKKGFQIARYEGNPQGKKAGLQGTEVGMTLFYTDLLMKIWNFNFQNATIDTGIEGFKPTTRIAVSSIYKSELEKYKYGRLWLEVDKNAFEIANEDRDIIFAPNVTRIQAATSDRPQSDEESNPRPDTAIFLDWWNKYYEEVAHYEPQYERLNQIMKWSLLINRLNQYQSNPLSFLQEVEVKRDNWFPDWIKKQGKNLKFTKWDKIKFFSEGYNYQGRKTEKLKYLQSEDIDEKYGKPYPYIYGGVSLASGKNFDARISLPNNSSISKLSRRFNIDYSSVKSKAGKLDEFTTLDGTKYKLIYPSKNASEIIIEPKSGIKFRTANAELTSENLKLIPKFESTLNNGLKLTTRLEDAKLGSTEFSEFNITKTQNGFRAAFESRDIDGAYSLVSDVSKYKGDIPTFIASKDNVVSVRYSPSQPKDIYVKQSNSNKWLKLSEGSGGGGDLPLSKSMMTVAEPGKDSRIWKSDFVDEAQVPEGFKEYRGKGADFPEKFNSRKQAQKLAEDPLALIKSSKLDLQLRIKNINSALKNGNYLKAEKIINESIQLYGSDPQIMLRKAALEQHLGRFKIEIITPEAATPIKQNFFDEINNRNFMRIETDTQFIYLQDSPSLSNIDFTKPITQTVSSDSGVRLYKLQPGKINGVPISQSGFGDVTASSHPSTKFKVNNIANSLKNQYQNSQSNDECNNQSAEEENQNPNCSPEKLEKPVYVVTES